MGQHLLTIYSSQVPGTFHQDSSIRTQNVKENSAKFLSEGLHLHEVKGLSHLDSFCMRILKLLLGCSINFLFKWVLITFGRGLRDPNSLNVIWSIKSVTLSFSNPRQFLPSLKSYSDRSNWCWPNVWDILFPDTVCTWQILADRFPRANFDNKLCQERASVMIFTFLLLSQNLLNQANVDSLSLPEVPKENKFTVPLTIWMMFPSDFVLLLLNQFR